VRGRVAGTHDEGCRHQVLARNEAGQLHRCIGCGALSLCVGPVTLRVDPATAEGLWALLGEGLHLVHQLESRNLTPPWGRA